MNKPRHQDVSLSEVHESVDTTRKTAGWKRIFSFFGPAYLVSVGYMDPGNWATDIAGGSQFGYTLIWVLLMSNLIAILLQSLSARLGIVRGRDLAQASREVFSRPVNLALYVFAEIAIASCDLAEVLGMAIGLQLLFHIPLIWGVCITILDTFLLLFLINFGIRKMEAFILGLIAIIGMAFLAEMFFAKPDLSNVLTGFIPSIPDYTALYIAIGIIGATVMPHNLYLHSSLVQTRKFSRKAPDIRKAIRYNNIDSIIALNLAFFINAAILILAASTFFKNGLFRVSEIQDAHQFLQPLLGTSLAPAFFAIALIASGQSSTLTGTLAGQIVMEGYIQLRIAPWIRRIITRMLAIIPTLFVIILFGEQATGKLLILSQVILSLQLGFAAIPLIHFVSDRRKMKEFVIPAWMKILAWIATCIIVSLNARLVFNQVSEWITMSRNPVMLWVTVVPVCFFAAGLLLYITVRPLFRHKEQKIIHPPHGEHQVDMIHAPQPYRKIAVAVDFSKMDQLAISHAIRQGGKNASYLFIHIVESAGAIMFNQDISDYEYRTDHQNLQTYAHELRGQGYDVKVSLGFGNPKKSIPQLVNSFGADLLVMAAHGHRGIKDLIFGTTVNAVRHRVHIPVLIVRE